MELEFDFGHPTASKTPQKPKKKAAVAKLSEKSADPHTPLTITEVTRRIRIAIQKAVGDVWVEGEISNHREQSSGHHYFTLKDSRAQLSCVLFRARAGFLRFPLKEGMQVRIQGEINVYEPRGQYQLIARTIQLSGEGALQMQFEELKAKLAAEGLFDQAHKKPLPKFPRTLALITSPTSAAVRDMIQVISRRAPWTHIIICPARVQGEGAAREVATQIDKITTASGKNGFPTIDTIITGRGGGSIEDLWAFNEEPLARTIAACPIPIISAVGHEIDFTIADFVADLRAPTPSAAAELAVPDGIELRARIRAHKSSLYRAVHSRIEDLESLLSRYSAKALHRHVGRTLDRHTQSLDIFRSELQRVASAHTLHHERRLTQLASRLAARRPDAAIADRSARIAAAHTALQTALAATLQRRATRLDRSRTALRTLSPDSILSRGFSFTTTPKGKTIRDASKLKPGQELHITFAKGKATTKVEAIKKPLAK